MEKSYVVVKTKQGQLRGEIKQSVFSQKSFYTFKGIPYAKAPLGKLRFKAPEPLDSWEGVRDALEDGSDCKQEVPPWTMTPEQIKLNMMTQGDEDCLYLNVSTNKLPSEEDDFPAQPVMVFLHGGGYAGGSGSVALCGPDFFLEEDVVFVSCNYRCGAFGFISLEIEEVPGNAGLKDQALALRWVQDNISSFGGDPNNVTLFGISAGAASVQYHLISPLSRGLFHKAIIQSGSSLNPWALQQDPLTRALDLARTLGCESRDPQEVLTFLQDVPADDIVLAQKKLYEGKAFDVLLQFLFTPCVEVTGSNPFLAECPDKLMELGKFQNVPLIMGSVSNEGSVLVHASRMNIDVIEDHNQNPTRYVETALRITCGADKKEEIGKAIQEFYMKGKAVSLDNLGVYLDFMGDIVVNIGVSRSRSMFLKHSKSPVYSYLFTNDKRCFCNALNITDKKQNLVSKWLKGACHGGELLYLFAPNYGKINTPEITHDDREAIISLIKAWTSFARTGDPNHDGVTEEWLRDSRDNPCVMELGESWSLRRGGAFQDRITFWDRFRRK